MEFKEPYVLAMREQAPKMFRELRRSGKMDQHLQEKSVEAHRLLREIMAGRPDNDQERRMAQEMVRAQLIEFPKPEREQNPEPPDDLHPGKTPA